MTSAGEMVDERVNLLVLRMFSRDPDDRHKDMGAVIFEMRTAMDMLGFSTGRARADRARPRNPPARRGPSGRTRQALRAFELFPSRQPFSRARESFSRPIEPWWSSWVAARLGSRGKLSPMRCCLRSTHNSAPTCATSTSSTRATRAGSWCWCERSRDLELFVHLSPGESHSREVLMLVMTTPEASE